MTKSAPRPRWTGWGGLALFWALLLLVLAGGATVLQIMGPPAPPRPHPALPAQSPAPTGKPASPEAKTAAGQEHAATTPRAIPLIRPGRDTPGPIADPDPALLASDPAFPNHPLPRIAAGGRAPMEVYAAGFDITTRRPRVGLIVAGIGLNIAASEQAIRTLPGGVTLAVSPYAHDPAPLLSDARIAQHEYLLSIPMEPQKFPLNDPGPHALLTSRTPEQNRHELDWALSRFAGYVGATGALGLMRGERFASVPEDMDPVLRDLAQRGLLYVDPRPGQSKPPFVWGRSVDLVVDAQATAAAITAKLEALDRIATEKGSALGLVGAPRPLTLRLVAAWANGLQAKGLALAPVSALVEKPAKTEARQ